jgi:hypothetical protein
VSQHIFNTKDAQGKGVTVTVGYDRPLNYVFCTVTSETGDVVYSNLDDDDAGMRQQNVDSRCQFSRSGNDNCVGSSGIARTS